MKTAPSPRLAGLLTVAGGWMVAGLASGRAELVVLAAVFVCFTAIGLGFANPLSLEATIKPRDDRLLEGESTLVAIRVQNGGGREVEVELALERAAQISAAPDGPVLLRLAGGKTVRAELDITVGRWGLARLGPVAVRSRDPLGISTSSRRLGTPVTVKVFPREQRLRALIEPLRTQPFLGVHVARARGAGIEFADIRPFAPGDQVRHINWRATARRRGLYINQRHPEQASDALLLLDTFAEARDRDGGTLDAAVRATSTLAAAHLERRDRVGLVDVGGILHWLEPAFGARQLYRIVDALLASEIAFSYAWREVESIPRRVLPPAALIIAISPLLDDRSIAMIVGLRRRGHDIVVLEVSPLAHVPVDDGPTAELARRLWRLQRNMIRTRLRADGIAVATWEHERQLVPALEEVNAFRRSARLSARA
jgi:uncharacterized protein (DUF58 family)